MEIYSFIPNSLSDWDGKVSGVIFVGGCNFLCPFCQNYPLAVKNPKRFNLEPLPYEEIEKTLQRNKRWLDGVVITGGEPLIHPEIFSLTQRIKRLGFPIKIDTNGSFPYVLMRLKKEGLIDYCALDIKTVLNPVKYQLATGRKVEIGLIERTIRFLLEGNLDYEFRTTLVRKFVGEEEIEEIGKKIAGGKRYYLQQYIPERARQKEFRRVLPYSREEAAVLLRKAKRYVKEVKLRGF
ncbi:MAG: anaerobic ribonucleoside-triphosphate reductase activating protein [candidate division WOR-3 bacterium]